MLITKLQGHVRFKTPHGARLAVILFSREYIVQTHKDDTGTLLQKQSKTKKNELLAKAAQDAILETEEWGAFDGGDESGDEPTEASGEVATKGKGNESLPRWPSIHLALLTGQHAESGKLLFAFAIRF